MPEEGLDGWIVRDRLDEIRDNNKLENYECNQLEKFCEEQGYDFEPCMQELQRRVSEKDKEKGIKVQYTKIITESMYIRPDFRKRYIGSGGYNRSSRNRYKPDMRNHKGYSIRYRAKDPNDPYLYRNRTPKGTVYDVSV